MRRTFPSALAFCEAIGVRPSSQIGVGRRADACSRLGDTTAEMQCSFHRNASTETEINLIEGRSAP